MDASRTEARQQLQAAAAAHRARSKTKWTSWPVGGGWIWWEGGLRPTDRGTREPGGTIPPAPAARATLEQRVVTLSSARMSQHPALLDQANRKQLYAELNPAPRDPFATKLSELVGGDGVAAPVAGGRRGQGGYGASSGGSQLGGSQLGGSQLNGSQRGGSQLSGSQRGTSHLGGSQRGGSQLGGSQLGPLPGRSGSQISVARSQHSQRSAASQRSQREHPAAAARKDDDLRSALSGVTSLSWRTPSTIRSSEPSEIARNKIAELQLRLELERVLRLQRETELEAQKAQNLALQAKNQHA